MRQTPASAAFLCAAAQAQGSPLAVQAEKLHSLCMFMPKCAQACIGGLRHTILTCRWDSLNCLPPLCRVFVNATLSGVQQRNLEVAWGRPVLDRIGLIIGIFGQRARTKEARLQVGCTAKTPGVRALAQHLLPRVKFARCWACSEGAC